MKELLTISGIIISIVCAGQSNSLRLRIYADFISAEIRTYDSTFEKKTELTFVTSVDEFNLTIDASYLQDYLNDNINNNDLYKNSFSGQDPTAYFDMPPTFGLGKTLREDKEVGLLLMKLIQDNMIKSLDIRDLKTDVEIKVIKDPKPYFKMGWDKFHKKYKNCYGIVRLSKIVFNDSLDRAMFYTENHKGSLDGSGDIVIMRKVNGTWTVEHYINQWIS